MISCRSQLVACSTNLTISACNKLLWTPQETLPLSSRRNRRASLTSTPCLTCQACSLPLQDSSMLSAPIPWAMVTLVKVKWTSVLRTSLRSHLLALSTKAMNSAWNRKQLTKQNGAPQLLSWANQQPHVSRASPAMLALALLWLLLEPSPPTASCAALRPLTISRESELAFMLTDQSRQKLRKTSK